jgi:hypothetical protein
MSFHTVFLILIAFVLFYELSQSWMSKHRCVYCGSLASHTPECPYNLERN